MRLHYQEYSVILEFKMEGGLHAFLLTVKTELCREKLAGIVIK